MMTLLRDQKLPIITTLFAAFLWGLWWIPIRQLNEIGLTGVFANIAMHIGVLVILAMYFVFHRRLPKIPRSGVLGLVFLGFAVTSFSYAIAYGDVLRAVLFFYLTPGWSKLLEWRILGKRLGLGDWLAVILALFGLLFVIEFNFTQTPLSGADVMAIASGLAWSLGSVFLYRGARPKPVDLAFYMGIASIGMGLFVAALTEPLVLPQTGWALGALLGILYVLPILLITMWSVTILRPATLGFLLTLEVIVGAISAAWILAEPFTWMTAIGGVLIIIAAISDVVWPKPADHSGG